MPDGLDYFVTGFTGWDNHRISVNMYSASVSQLARIPGTFRLTLSILDTASQVRRTTYLNYGMLTVLPLNVIVHDSA